jgi:hypothetical protein
VAGPGTIRAKRPAGDAPRLKVPWPSCVRRYAAPAAGYWRSASISSQVSPQAACFRERLWWAPAKFASHWRSWVRQQMIINIQLLRGLAALAVAFYHAGYVIPGTVYTDFLGVPVFFVISGFIMTHITRASSDGFLLHRLIRIVPLYWLATAF